MASDEVFIKVRGETHDLWRVADHDGNVLHSELVELFVESQGIAKAATRFFKKLLNGWRYASRVLITVRAMAWLVSRCVCRSNIGSTKD